MGNAAKKILTVCIVHKHPLILLGMKKRGFGAGRWNGFGGKVELGEAVEDAAKREILEEAGIKVASLDKVGEIEFEFKGNPAFAKASAGEPEILQVHIFKAGDFEGILAESEEMMPKWF